MAAEASFFLASISSRTSAFLLDSMPMALIMSGKVIPCTTKVKRMTEKVRNKIRSLPGKGAPEGKEMGIARAAARDTTPRMPVQPVISTNLQLGCGSFFRMEGYNHLGT